MRIEVSIQRAFIYHGHRLNHAVTTQFAVGRTRSAQVVRKQFPLRPAAAKTIHRSQGDTENKIVVNFDTKKQYPTYIMLA